MAMWHLAALLHNLPLNSPVGNKYIAVVPSDDIRIAHLAEQDGFRHLVNSFSDQFGREVRPSLLIAHDRVPKKIDPIIAFRNILAVSAICHAWENFLANGSQLEYFKYADYFDLYPYSLSKNGDVLIVHSPSILGLDEVNEFRGQTTPEIGTARSSDHFYDDQLFSALLQKWTDRYIKRSKYSWSTEVLFRSLEMAYRASVIPYQNRASINDYGAHLALWVSSHEILARPESENARPDKVLALLTKATFDSARLRATWYRVFSGKNRRPASLVEKLYMDMHNARNDFLHGNPITLKSVFPSKKTNRSPLTSFAPVVYKCALYSFLNLWKGRKPLSQGATSEFIRRRNFEEALLASTKRRRRRATKRQSQRSS